MLNSKLYLKQETEFVEAIERNDSIICFRHISPDPDAFGSQWGVTTWIKDNYPEKKVYAAGFELGINRDFYPDPDTITDEMIAESLVIITDTSTADRVDDQRYINAKESYRIDHHIFAEKVADQELIDSNAGAACEIIANMFAEMEDKVFSKKAATYLYSGLIMDTLNFKTSNTNPNTFLAASNCVRCGIDLQYITNAMNNVSKSVYDYVTTLRARLIYHDEGVAYCFAHKEDYEPFGLSNADARSKVSAFGTVKEFKIWCLFTENTDPTKSAKYFGSIRSHVIPVNKIAEKYHGGGHANACGIKLYSKEEGLALIEDLRELAKNYTEEIYE